MTGSGLKQKRQLFPDKLWDLVNNQPLSGIHWSKNGKRIEIDRTQLEKFLQTRLLDRNTNPINGNTKFRSHNFDSFIRQLHFYGFKKSGNSYYHEKFQRERPDVLCTMKRKYSTLPQTSNQTKDKQHVTSGIEPDQTTSFVTSSSCSSSSTLSSLSSSSSSSTTSDIIKMYTIDSSGCEDGHLSLTNVREANVKAVRDEKCVKISIQELMLSDQKHWPKTLVLENNNVFSAYFIYKY